MAEEKLTLQDKKIKLRKLKSLLNTAFKISNDLIGEEDTHSQNENLLYSSRNSVQQARLSLNYIKYQKTK
jgi:hypothetical protein